jgi:hypothetical protein
MRALQRHARECCFVLQDCRCVRLGKVVQLHSEFSIIQSDLECGDRESAAYQTRHNVVASADIPPLSDAEP